MGIPKPLVKANQLFITLTTALALVWNENVLLLPVAVGLITIVTRKNPVIILGKNFLTKPSNKYKQEDKEQQLFNQWIATILLTSAFIAFSFNFNIAGYIFSLMVILASGIAFFGYCIGCTIRYRYMMWKYKKTV